MNQSKKFMGFVGRTILSMGIGYMIGYTIGVVAGLTAYPSLVIGSVLSVLISIPVAIYPYIAKNKTKEVKTDSILTV